MITRIALSLIVFIAFFTMTLGYNSQFSINDNTAAQMGVPLMEDSPQYKYVEIKLDFSSEGCDSIVSKTDTKARASLFMANSFPIGDTTFSFALCFFMNADEGTVNLSEALNSPVDLVLSSYYDYRWDHCLYQKYNSDTTVYANIYEMSGFYRRLCDLGFSFVEHVPVCFEDKYLPVNFIEAFNYFKVACSTQACDTSGIRAATISQGNLNIISDSIMILMGEFSVDKVTGGACAATQSLYVRNTFDLDTFKIRVHSPDPQVEINTINNSVRSGVSFSKIDDYTFDVYSTGDFSSISANGEEYTKVAEIEYTIDGACSPYQWIYIIPVLSDSSKMMKDGAGDEQYVVLDADTLAIYCQACGSGGSSKLAWDENQTGMLPTEFNLYPCRPNPFNPSTEVAFDVPVTCPVTICIYNILGQEVATLVDRELEAGRHSVIWNSTDNSGRTVSSGIYLCVMRAGEYTASQKMSLMK